MIHTTIRKELVPESERALRHMPFRERVGALKNLWAAMLLIVCDYLTFQEWYWERELARGASDDDIRAYPTVQVVEAMREWVDAGRPV
jgi:hypothetical protein